MTDEKQEIERERPPAPDGSVYLQDVLDIVRRHAELNSWCTLAEDSVSSKLAMYDDQLRPFIEVPYAVRRGYCCPECNRGMNQEDWDAFVPTADPRLFERFNLHGEHRDATVSLTVLSEIFADHRTIDRASEEFALIDEIRTTFAVPGLSSANPTQVQ